MPKLPHCLGISAGTRYSLTATDGAPNRSHRGDPILKRPYVVQHWQAGTAAVLALGLGFVAAVVLGVAAVVYEHGRVITGGPLGCPRCGRTSLTGPVIAGRPAANGLIVLSNASGEDAVIDRVELVGANFRGSFFLTPNPPGVHSTRNGTPLLPPGSKPAIGYPIPGDGSEFSFSVVFPARRPARSFFQNVVLYYHVGGTRYRAPQGLSVAYCAHRPSSPNRDAPCNP